MGEREHPGDQIDKFRNLARELGADEDPAHFEETVRKIAPTRPAAPIKSPEDER